ncbi:hypothetical protein Pmani_038016 [Petrolisthes manimaculis]|uniref:Uncharacterized protein n=1 Tax=Petrolisthes manimaculis TaxID=1843537 RepID=A0AAE1NF60_9EUCA|nr:hypothetical protein Pmani_038016 [Petrolisthes manimaculis]
MKQNKIRKENPSHHHHHHQQWTERRMKSRRHRCVLFDDDDYGFPTYNTRREILTVMNLSQLEVYIRQPNSQVV